LVKIIIYKMTTSNTMLKFNTKLKISQLEAVVEEQRQQIENLEKNLEEALDELDKQEEEEEEEANTMLMPYTLQDIQSCKDITFDRVKKDYNNLIKFKADTNPRKFCGNPTLYYYQYRALLRARRENKETIEEIFANEDKKQKLWLDTIKRNRRQNDICSAVDVYECYRINSGAIVFFKASTAKFIYKKFNATSVLDPTAGWGGRLLGASSLNIKYTGMDSNLSLKAGYDKMIDDLEIKNCRMIYCKSCLDLDFSEMDYDLVLTSPPYINMELYEYMQPFQSKDSFYKNFMIPMLDRCFKYMKPGGNMCINISPKMYKELIEKYNYRSSNDKIDLRQQLGKQYKTKSQDYIYIWTK